MKKLLAIILTLLFIPSTVMAQPTITIGETVSSSTSTDYTAYSSCMVALLFDGDLTDATTNGRDATNNGATSLPTSGKFGGCYDFEYSEADWVELDAYISSFRTLETGTVVIYINPESNQYGHFWCIGGNEEGHAGAWVGTAWYTDSKEQIWHSTKISETNDPDAKSADGSVTVGTWYHIAIVVENGVGNKIYIDGLQINPTYDYGSATSDDFFADVNNNLQLDSFRVGASDRGTYDTYFDGKCDEFGLFNIVLSDAEIFDIATNGLKG